MHRTTLGQLGAATLALLMFTVLLRAEDANPPDDGRVAESTAGEGSAQTEVSTSATATDSPKLETLVRQLDSDRFAQRQAASRRLTEAGKAAIPALMDAGLQGGRESATRAIEILGRFFRGPDADTRAAAQTALEGIAASTATAAARLAKEVLEPKEEPASEENVILGGQVFPGVPIQIQAGGIQLQGGAFPMPGGPIQINGGQAQIQLHARGGLGGVQRVEIRVINGVKDVQANEAGRKVEIHEQPGGPIKITVTEKDGRAGKEDGEQPKDDQADKDKDKSKEIVKTYEAKNLDELKQNHPEAYQLYQRYAGGQLGGPLQIQLPAIPNLPVPPPAP